MMPDKVGAVVTLCSPVRLPVPTPLAPFVWALQRWFDDDLVAAARRAGDADAADARGLFPRRRHRAVAGLRARRARTCGRSTCRAPGHTTIGSTRWRGARRPVPRRRAALIHPDALIRRRLRGGMARSASRASVSLSIGSAIGQAHGLFDSEGAPLRRRAVRRPPGRPRAGRRPALRGGALAGQASARCWRRRLRLSDARSALDVAAATPNRSKRRCAAPGLYGPSCSRPDGGVVLYERGAGLSAIASASFHGDRGDAQRPREHHRAGEEGRRLRPIRPLPRRVRG